MFRNYILETRYLAENEHSFEDIIARVSKHIANSSSDQSTFYNIMLSKKFIPAGRTLAYAGTNHKLNPNCVVLDIHDSMEGIYDTLKRATVLQKHGCGLGFNFSELRPAGYKCVSSGDIASGPLSYMSVYSHSFKIVQQHGRSGANIGILSIEHPDILGFIHMKDDLRKFTNFNISVLITPRFINQLKQNPSSKWLCSYKNTLSKPRLIDYNDEFVYTDISEIDITVEELWQEIVHAAWSTGEPGLLFEDNINKQNPLKHIFGNIKSCNPCGEVVMYENECCNLGSINLEEFCEENPNFNSTFDEIKHFIKITDLQQTTHTAIEFLNRVIDYLDIPDERLDKNVKLLRRIGLGIMGLADMLIKLKVSYDSSLGRTIAGYVLQTIYNSAEETSRKLISQYKSVYERLDENGYDLTKITAVENNYLQTHANVGLLAIAPNGSTSLIFNVSSGIEPYFSLAYKRTLKGQLQPEIVMNKHLEKLLKSNNLYNESIINQIISDNSLVNIKELDKNYVEIYKTAQTMSYEAHVLMQVEAQKYVDNSISKTCNLAQDTSEQVTSEILLKAYELGVKGITIYRDKSRESQVFQLVKDTCKDGKCDI